MTPDFSRILNRRNDFSRGIDRESQSCRASRIESNAGHLGVLGSPFAMIRSSKQPEALAGSVCTYDRTQSSVRVLYRARRDKQEEVTLRWNKLPNNYSNETRSSLVAVKTWLAGVSREAV